MTHIRLAVSLLLLTAALFTALPSWASPMVYRGSLSDRGKPAEGVYGFRLTFYDAQLGGRPLAPATTLDGVAVSNGVFSAELDLAASLQAHEQLWLEVEVRDATGLYVPLAEREGVAPKATTAGICWDTTGNSANVDGTNFLGNITSVPLEFRSANRKVMRLEPLFEPTKGGDTPNVIAGSSANFAASLAAGAVIAGGGATTENGVVCANCRNAVNAQFATVSGGVGNTSSNYASVIAGGEQNEARGYLSSIGGGGRNLTTASFSVVPGGAQNCAGGDNSFAGGTRAVVRPAGTASACGAVPTSFDANGDEGTFIWSDVTSASFVSTGPNQFLVQATGGVAFNTTPPNSAYEMTVKGTQPFGGNVDLGLYSFGASNDGIQITATAGGAGTNDGELVIGQSNGNAYTERLRIGTTGDLSITSANAIKPGGGTWTAPSDRRIKQDVSSIHGAVDTLLRLRPVSFHYTEAYRAQQGGLADTRYLGFIAQEFAEVFPQAVSESGQPLPASPKAPAAGSAESILALDSSPALITTVAAAQELAVESEAQAERIARLEAENARLRSEHAALRSRFERVERLLLRHPGLGN